MCDSSWLLVLSLFCFSSGCICFADDSCFLNLLRILVSQGPSVYNRSDLLKWLTVGCYSAKVENRTWVCTVVSATVLSKTSYIQLWFLFLNLLRSSVLYRTIATITAAKLANWSVLKYNKPSYWEATHLQWALSALWVLEIVFVTPEWHRKVSVGTFYLTAVALLPRVNGLLCIIIINLSTTLVFHTGTHCRRLSTSHPTIFCACNSQCTKDMLLIIQTICLHGHK